MAKKKKTTKAKAAKKSKPAKKKSSSKKKSPAKKHSKKKIAKKKVVKKAVGSKRKAVGSKKKAVSGKKAAVKKKAVGSKQSAVRSKKAVVKKKLIKKVVVEKIAHVKPVVHKIEHHEVKIAKPVVQEVLQLEVVQQEAGHSGDHRESFVPHVTSLKVGDTAPYFMGSDQHGNLLSLNDFHGKTLILYFYPKDDTDGCTAESCSLRDEYAYISAQNHVVVGVSADDVESHKHFAEKFNLPFSLIADTNMDMIKAYDVWGQKRLFDKIYDGIVRTTFIIKDNKIARVITSVNNKNHGKQVMES